ncbi:uncharacterized protein LOC134057433, partial [Cinclus cinclus]|uniref:uncharacterized protein LOC134057433 n=1 Tax=Cinclus cinclus TaxID=127875 RepID=UPI002E1331BF
RVRPDFVLVREEPEGGAGGAPRRFLAGLHLGGVPSSDPLPALYGFAHPPCLFAQLARLQRELGHEAFPLVPQHFCNRPRGLLTTPTFPMTVMLSPAPAGVGQVRPRPFPTPPTGSEGARVGVAKGSGYLWVWFNGRGQRGQDSMWVRVGSPQVLGAVAAAMGGARAGALVQEGPAGTQRLRVQRIGEEYRALRWSVGDGDSVGEGLQVEPVALSPRGRGHDEGVATKREVVAVVGVVTVRGAHRAGPGLVVASAGPRCGRGSGPDRGAGAGEDEGGAAPPTQPLPRSATPTGVGDVGVTPGGDPPPAETPTPGCAASGWPRPTPPRTSGAATPTNGWSFATPSPPRPHPTTWSVPATPTRDSTPPPKPGGHTPAPPNLPAATPTNPTQLASAAPTSHAHPAATPTAGFLCIAAAPTQPAATPTNVSNIPAPPSSPARFSATPTWPGDVTAAPPSSPARFSATPAWFRDVTTATPSSSAHFSATPTSPAHQVRPRHLSPAHKPLPPPPNPASSAPPPSPSPAPKPRPPPASPAHNPGPEQGPPESLRALRQSFASLFSD